MSAPHLLCYAGDDTLAGVHIRCWQPLYDPPPAARKPASEYSSSYGSEATSPSSTIQSSNYTPSTVATSKSYDSVTDGSPGSSVTSSAPSRVLMVSPFRRITRKAQPSATERRHEQTLVTSRRGPFAPHFRDTRPARSGSSVGSSIASTSSPSSSSSASSSSSDASSIASSSLSSSTSASSIESSSSSPSVASPSSSSSTTSTPSLSSSGRSTSSSASYASSYSSVASSSSIASSDASSSSASSVGSSSLASPSSSSSSTGSSSIGSSSSPSSSSASSPSTIQSTTPSSSSSISSSIAPPRRPSRGPRPSTSQADRRHTAAQRSVARGRAPPKARPEGDARGAAAGAAGGAGRRGAGGATSGAAHASPGDIVAIHAAMRDIADGHAAPAERAAVGQDGRLHVWPTGAEWPVGGYLAYSDGTCLTIDAAGVALGVGVDALPAAARLVSRPVQAQTVPSNAQRFAVADAVDRYGTTPRRVKIGWQSDGHVIDADGSPLRYRLRSPPHAAAQHSQAAASHRQLQLQPALQRQNPDQPSTNVGDVMLSLALRGEGVAGLRVTRRRIVRRASFDDHALSALLSSPPDPPLDGDREGCGPGGVPPYRNVFGSDDANAAGDGDEGRYDVAGDTMTPPRRVLPPAPTGAVVATRGTGRGWAAADVGVDRSEDHRRVGARRSASAGLASPQPGVASDGAVYYYRRRRVASARPTASGSQAGASVSPTHTDRAHAARVGAATAAPSARPPMPIRSVPSDQERPGDQRPDALGVADVALPQIHIGHPAPSLAVGTVDDPIARVSLASGTPSAPLLAWPATLAVVCCICCGGHVPTESLHAAARAAARHKRGGSAAPRSSHSHRDHGSSRARSAPARQLSRPVRGAQKRKTKGRRSSGSSASMESVSSTLDSSHVSSSYVASDSTSETSDSRGSGSSISDGTLATSTVSSSAVSTDVTASIDYSSSASSASSSTNASTASISDSDAADSSSASSDTASASSVATESIASTPGPKAKRAKRAAQPVKTAKATATKVTAHAKPSASQGKAAAASVPPKGSKTASRDLRRPPSSVSSVADSSAYEPSSVASSASASSVADSSDYAASSSSASSIGTESIDDSDDGRTDTSASSSSASSVAGSSIADSSVADSSAYDSSAASVEDSDTSGAASVADSAATSSIADSDSGTRSSISDDSSSGHSSGSSVASSDATSSIKESTNATSSIADTDATSSIADASATSSVANTASTSSIADSSSASSIADSGGSSVASSSATSSIASSVASSSASAASSVASSASSVASVGDSDTPPAQQQKQKRTVRPAKRVASSVADDDSIHDSSAGSKSASVASSIASSSRSSASSINSSTPSRKADGTGGRGTEGTTGQKPAARRATTISSGDSVGDATSSANSTAADRPRPAVRPGAAVDRRRPAAGKSQSVSSGSSVRSDPDTATPQASRPQATAAGQQRARRRVPSSVSASSVDDGEAEDLDAVECGGRRGGRRPISQAGSAVSDSAASAMNADGSAEQEGTSAESPTRPDGDDAAGTGGDSEASERAARIAARAAAAAARRAAAEAAAVAARAAKDALVIDWMGGVDAAAAEAAAEAATVAHARLLVTGDAGEWMAKAFPRMAPHDDSHGAQGATAPVGPEEGRAVGSGSRAAAKRWWEIEDDVAFEAYLDVAAVSGWGGAVVDGNGALPTDALTRSAAASVGAVVPRPCASSPPLDDLPSSPSLPPTAVGQPAGQPTVLPRVEQLPAALPPMEQGAPPVAPPHMQQPLGVPSLLPTGPPAGGATTASAQDGHESATPPRVMCSPRATHGLRGVAGRGPRPCPGADPLPFASALTPPPPPHTVGVRCFRAKAAAAATRASWRAVRLAAAAARRVGHDAYALAARAVLPVATRRRLAALHEGLPPRREGFLIATRALDAAAARRLSELVDAISSAIPRPRGSPPCEMISVPMRSRARGLWARRGGLSPSATAAATAKQTAARRGRRYRPPIMKARKVEVAQAVAGAVAGCADVEFVVSTIGPVMHLLTSAVDAARETAAAAVFADAWRPDATAVAASAVAAALQIVSSAVTASHECLTGTAGATAPRQASPPVDPNIPATAGTYGPALSHLLGVVESDPRPIPADLDWPRPPSQRHAPTSATHPLSSSWWGREADAPVVDRWWESPSQEPRIGPNLVANCMRGETGGNVAGGAWWRVCSDENAPWGAVPGSTPSIAPPRRDGQHGGNNTVDPSADPTHKRAARAARSAAREVHGDLAGLDGVPIPTHGTSGCTSQ